MLGFWNKHVLVTAASLRGKKVNVNVPLRRIFAQLGKYRGSRDMLCPGYQTTGYILGVRYVQSASNISTTHFAEWCSYKRIEDGAISVHLVLPATLLV